MNKRISNAGTRSGFLAPAGCATALPGYNTESLWQELLNLAGSPCTDRHQQVDPLRS